MKEYETTVYSKSDDLAYTMCHYVLKNLALNQAEELLALAGDPDELIKELIFEAWLHSEQAEPPAPNAFDCERIQVDEYEVLLITYPAPVRLTHPWKSAVVWHQHSAATRYFVLENSMASTVCNPQAMLCEWVSSDKHKNYGKFNGNVNDSLTFISAVNTIRR